MSSSEQSRGDGRADADEHDPTEQWPGALLVATHDVRLAEALRIDPYDAAAWDLAGRAMAGKGQFPEALYDFVAKNFRYVSLSLGVGRYQPHAASDVLHDQYGDCKDKHTLLASLLEAEGLHADSVLINSSRKLDPDVPSPSQFDHVITMLPMGPGRLTNVLCRESGS